MAFGRQTDNKLVKPLEGAIVRRFTAGAAIEAGELLAMQSDGYVDPADASADATIVGASLQDVAAGSRVDVVVFGPVVAHIDATPGATIYATDTAGEPGTSAGTNTIVAGFAESATVLFVNVQRATA